MRFRALSLPAVLACILFTGAAHAGPCDAHFTFDGNLSDASGNGYDGRLIGKGGGATSGAPSYGEGRNGKALLLSGAYAVRAPIDLSKEVCPQVTISAWVKFDDDPTKGTQYIFSSGRGGPNLSRAGIGLDARGGNQRELVKSGLRGGRWEFIAMAVDQELGKMKVYWRQRVFERDTKPTGTTSADIWIGAIGDDLRQPVLAGAIDDVRVFGQVLTANQVKQIQSGISRQPGASQMPGDEMNPNLGLWTPGDQIDPNQIPGDELNPNLGLWEPGDGTGEVGVPGQPGVYQTPEGQVATQGSRPGQDLNDLFVPSPETDDQIATADAEQRTMMGQTDSLPGPGNLDGSSDTPTSMMPGGSRGTDLSGNESLQQAVDENAPPDITYDSEEEGQAAAAAADALRAEQSVEEANFQRGYSFSSETRRGALTGLSGTTSIPLDLVDDQVTRIWIGEVIGYESQMLSRVTFMGSKGRGKSEGQPGPAEKIVSVSRQGVAIGNLRVCMDSPRSRFAGLRAEGNVLGEDGSFGEYVSLNDQLGSCGNNWSQDSRCPIDWVATGLVAHFVSVPLAYSRGQRLVGLQLLCRRVIPNN